MLMPTSPSIFIFRHFKELAWVQKNLDEAKRDGQAEFNANYERLQKEVETTTLKLKSREEKIEVNI